MQWASHCWLGVGAAVCATFEADFRQGHLSSPGFGVGVVGLVTLVLSGFTAFDLLLYRSRSELSSLICGLTFGLSAMC
jgi:hypothetical protein